MSGRQTNAHGTVEIKAYRTPGGSELAGTVWVTNSTVTALFLSTLARSINIFM